MDRRQSLVTMSAGSETTVDTLVRQEVSSMKRIARIVSRGPTKPAGNSWLNVLYELPEQQLRTASETDAATRKTVLEALAKVLTGRRGRSGNGPVQEYCEATGRFRKNVS